jgi:hypothetical protein
MTRGSEVVRELPPDTLVPTRALDEARRRASGRAGKKRSGLLPPRPDEHLVALYACYPDERTPECRLPADSPTAKWQGLLTYTLCEVLTQAPERLTYRELAQRIQIQYARRPTGRQTPFVEGIGQKREVLGTKEWPERSGLLLRKKGDRYRVNQGDLHGLTRGSVLAVYPPGGAARTEKPLGHVRLTATAPVEADVEPCPYAGTPARAELPDLGDCRLVYFDYGARRFRLAVDLPEGERRRAVLEALRRLNEPKDGPVELVQDLARAEWVIRQDKAGLALVDAAAAGTRFALPDSGGARLRRELDRCLMRIYRAQNLLQVAARADSGLVRGKSGFRVEVEVLRHRGKDDPGEVVAPTDGQRLLRKGERVSYRVRNRNRFAVDVTLLIVGPDLTIAPFYPRPDEQGENRVAPGGTLVTPPPLGEVQEPFGVEHLVLIAAKSRTPPFDFTCLARERSPDGPNASLASPLGQLLGSAVYGTGDTRGLEWVAVADHGLRVLSWRVVPR